MNGHEEYEKKAPHLLKRYEHSRRVFGEFHAETQGCIHWLAKVYEFWDKLEEAEKWRAKLAADVADQEPKGPRATDWLIPHYVFAGLVLGTSHYHLSPWRS